MELTQAGSWITTIGIPQLTDGGVRLAGAGGTYAFHDPEVPVRFAILEAGMNAKKHAFPEPRSAPKDRRQRNGSARHPNLVTLPGGRTENPTSSFRSARKQSKFRFSAECWPGQASELGRSGGGREGSYGAGGASPGREWPAPADP